MSTTITSTTSIDDLELVYIERVNQAVEQERFDVVDALAAEFDAELSRRSAA